MPLSEVTYGFQKNVTYIWFVWLPLCHLLPRSGQTNPRQNLSAIGATPAQVEEDVLSGYGLFGRLEFKAETLCDGAVSYRALVNI
jgi:hypothetical protein